MIIYIIILVVLLLPILSKRSFGNWYFKCECLILILTVGLRNKVGGDTLGYMTDWSTYPILSKLNLLHFILYRYQPGWIILNSGCKTLYSEFFILQLVYSSILNICIFYVIHKYSTHKYCTVLLYYLLAFLYFNCEILREGLSICTFLFAFNYFYNKKWLKFYLLIIIGFLFHDGIIIFAILPLFHSYLVKSISLKKYLLAFTVGFLLLNPIVIKKILFLLPGNRGETFEEGYGNMQIGSLLGYLRGFALIITYILISFTKAMRVNKIVTTAYVLFIYINIIGLFLPIFSSRVSNYVKVYNYIAITFFLYQNGHIKLKIVYAFMMFLSFYRYYFNDVTYWVNRNPELTKDKYYFYELFYPYYSIFEDPDPEIIARREKIYNQNATN